MAAFEERDPRPLYMITGMINTKDPKGYFEAFEGLTRQVYTVAFAIRRRPSIPSLWRMMRPKQG